MRGWKETVIGEYADVLSGFAFKSKDFQESRISDDYLPIIKIKNVANGDVNLNEVVYHKVDPNTNKYILKANDILIALTGNHPFAKTQVVGGVSRYKLEQQSLLNQRVAKIYSKSNTKLNDDFIYYFFKWSRTHFYLGTQSGGSASQANISKNDVLKTPINLPPLNKQQEIATILSTLDQKITLLKKQNQTLEELAQALFKRWFVDFEFPLSAEMAASMGKPNEQGKPYKSSGGKMVDSELGEIPEGWSVFELGFVSSLSAGGDKPKNTTLQPDEDNKIPIYSNGISNEGLYGYTNSPKISEESVTVSARGTIGYVCLRMQPFVPIVRLVTVIPNQKYLSSKFLFFWLKNQSISGTGTTQQQLTVPDFKSSKVIIPKFELMKEFSIAVNSIYKIIVINQSQIQTLTQLRDTLLPKLMSGQLEIEKESLSHV